MFSFFTNPLILAGLVLVGLPWLIDWLFRRRKRQVELPTLRFILDNKEQEKIRRQDRILMLVRALGLLFLIFALSRPVLQKGLIGGARERNVVIALDGTGSMNQQVGLTTAFGMAQKKAADLVRSLPEKTTVTLLHFTNRPEFLFEQEEDLYTAAARIEALRSGLGICSANRALEKVQAFIENKKLKNPEVYIFSDFQKTTWSDNAAEGARLMNKISNASRLFMVDVGGEVEFNYIVTDFTPEEKVMTTDIPVVFNANVRTWGDTDSNDGEESRATLAFIVDGVKKDVREIATDRSEQVVKFKHKFLNPGEHLAEVVLEGDNHHIDNNRKYLATVPKSFKALILDDGAVIENEAEVIPGLPDVDRESAFLSLALDPPTHSGMARVSRFTSKVIHPARIAYENLEEYPLVIMTQTRTLTKVMAGNLYQYVAAGGNLWVFSGPDVNAYEYNKLLYDEGKGVLPCEIEKKEITGKDGIAEISFEKSGRSSLTGLGAAGTSEAGVLKYSGIKKAENARVMLALADGTPLTVERAVGRGRAVFTATTAGIRWSYFPAAPEFPLFVQSVARDLVGNPDGMVNLETGDVFRQPVYVSKRHLLLQKPDGSKTRLTPSAVGGDENNLEVAFSDTVQHGVYQIVEAPSGALPRRQFVVNQGAGESELESLSEEECRNMFAGSDWHWIAPEVSLSDTAARLYSVTEFASWLLWMLVLVLCVETFLAARYGRRRSIVRAPTEGEVSE